MQRILVVEDQLKLRRNLHQLLEQNGYDVVVSEDGDEGFHCANTQEFDCIVLDLTLPGRDGREILRSLRSAGSQIPVLILTARDSIEDRVEGLDDGADDYIVKPFSHFELLARIRAALRRSQSGERLLLRCQDVQLDVLARRVTRAGIEIDLSQREFELLEYLMRQKNSNVNREMLARDVWKESGEILTNAIDVCINGLRKKLDLVGTRPFVTTVRGVGYTVKDQP